jgi:hypothetical protein
MVGGFVSRPPRTKWGYVLAWALTLGISWLIGGRWLVITLLAVGIVIGAVGGFGTRQKPGRPLPPQVAKYRWLLPVGVLLIPVIVMRIV